MKVDQAIEIFALAAGLVTLKFIRPVFLKILLMLLGLTVLNETIIIPYAKLHFTFNRNIFYVLFSLVDMLTWLYIFRRILEKDKLVIWLDLLALGIFIWTGIEINSPEGWFSIHPNSMRFYQLTIIFLSVFCLYKNLKKKYHPVFTDPLFWIYAACIIYNSIGLIRFTILPETVFWQSPDAERISITLNNTTNVCYYTLLSACFLTCFFNSGQRR